MHTCAAAAAAGIENDDRFSRKPDPNPNSDRSPQELKVDFSETELLKAVKALEIRDTNNPPSTPPKPECLDEGGEWHPDPIR